MLLIHLLTLLVREFSCGERGIMQEAVQLANDKVSTRMMISREGFLQSAENPT